MLSESKSENKIKSILKNSRSKSKNKNKSKSKPKSSKIQNNIKYKKEEVSFLQEKLKECETKLRTVNNKFNNEKYILNKNKKKLE